MWEKGKGNMEMRILQNALHPIMFCGLLPMCRACFSMKSTNFPPPIEMCVRRTTDRPFLSSFLVLIDIEKKHICESHILVMKITTCSNFKLVKIFHFCQMTYIKLRFVPPDT